MNYKIKLNDKYVTEFVALPISIQKTVDESLDQASIRLVFTDIAEPIKPLSNIDIEFWNDTQSEIKKTYSFFVSNDNVTHNIASGTYNHELALIELTKWLERFTNIVKCNTIPLIHDYNELIQPIYYTKTMFQNGNKTEVTTYSITADYSSPVTPQKQKIKSADVFNFLNEITPKITEYLDFDALKVYENGNLIFKTPSISDSASIDLKSGLSYKIEYMIGDGQVSVIGNQIGYKVEMYIDCIATEKAKNKSVPEVIQLLLNNFETLTLAQAPRFALDLDFIEKYKNLDAPEINMQGTLFECLSQIGDFIHCIPRLRKRSIENNDILIPNQTKYIITFDELDTDKIAEEDLGDFVGHTQSFSIEQYATTLDSNIDNLINTDNVGEGTLVEPNLIGWKTPRTDTVNVVIDTENCFIETSEAIEQIIKVEVGYIGNDYIGDITPFIYSKTEYDGQLSSISENYPLSKGFALYYQQGAKNIYGLTFELPNAISFVFSNYAIFNIIKQKTGKDYSKSIDVRDLQFRVTYVPNTNGRVKQQKTELQDGLSSSINFNQNASKITSNLFGEAIKGALAKLGNPEITKSYILTDVNQVPKEGQKFDDDYYISVVRTENYNDLIRCDLGLSKNYNRKDKYMALNSQIRFYEVSEIQAVDRQLYYEDYCIIGDDVETIEVKTYDFETTEPLVKLQEGTNAIELKQFGDKLEFLTSQDRVYRSLIVDITNLPFTDITTGITFVNIENTHPKTINVEYTGTADTRIKLNGVIAMINKPLITLEGLNSFASGFDANKTPITIDNVFCKTFTQSVEYSNFTMPLTSLAIGNSIFFHYEFLDNFTAGTKRNDIDNTDVITRLQYQQSYADNFGEFDYMHFSMGTIATLKGFEPNTQEKAVDYGNNLPTIPEGSYIISYFEAKDTTAINVNKDSSEVIAMNYQVNFVTNNNIIIGTDMARNTIFIAKEPLNYKLYLLPKKIDKFAREIDLTRAVDLGSVTYEINEGKKQIKLADVFVSGNQGESWAICNGNKLIFGKNERIAPNTILTLPFLTFKHII